MSTALQYFKALSDETRLRLIHVLNRYELSVNELVSLLEMGQSRVSRHLKILAGAGLLTSRRDGLWVFYAATREGDGRAFLDSIGPFVAADMVMQADVDMAGKIIEERALKTRQFFNSIAEDWDELNREVLGGFDLPGAVFSAMPKCNVAVDLGCGTGSVLERMLQQSREVIGVDGSPRMLELARRRFVEEGDRVSLRIGDLEHLPLRDGEVDFACINMVLHHLSDPAAVLAEVRRVIRPGGFLMVTDFDRHNNERMRSDYGDRWLGFEAAALGGLLEEAGYVVSNLRHQPVAQGLALHLMLAQNPDT